MKLKPGVDVLGIKPELILAMIIAEPIIVKHAPFVVTSICDGQHMKTSLHYSGLAMDIRTRDIDPTLVRPCVQELQESLGSQYDVVLEGDHIHLEFDPPKG